MAALAIVSAAPDGVDGAWATIVAVWLLVILDWRCGPGDGMEARCRVQEGQRSSDMVGVVVAAFPMLSVTVRHGAEGERSCRFAPEQLTLAGGPTTDSGPGGGWCSVKYANLVTD